MVSEVTREWRRCIWVTVRIFQVAPLQVHLLLLLVHHHQHHQPQHHQLLRPLYADSSPWSRITQGSVQVSMSVTHPVLVIPCLGAHIRERTHRQRYIHSLQHMHQRMYSLRMHLHMHRMLLVHLQARTCHTLRHTPLEAPVPFPLVTVGSVRTPTHTHTTPCTTVAVHNAALLVLKLLRGMLPVALVGIHRLLVGIVSAHRVDNVLWARVRQVVVYVLQVVVACVHLQVWIWIYVRTSQAGHLVRWLVLHTQLMQAVVVLK